MTGARQSILALRKDPQISALMAGEYAKSTQGAMRAALGREVCGGELYAAHFLGPDAACKLIRLAGQRPRRQRRGAVSPGRRRQQNRFLPCRWHAQNRARSL